LQKTRVRLKCGRNEKVFHQGKQEVRLNQNKNSENWNVNVSGYWVFYGKLLVGQQLKFLCRGELT